MSHADRPRLPLIARLFVPVIVFFTAVGVIETAFVGYDWLTQGSLSALRAPDLGRGIRSWTEHHAMKPGFSDSAARLNSFGLRSPEVAIPKPPGTVRILLLGDSFTFGYQAATDEIFARRLEERLTGTGGTKIEVVNAGVLSYCPLLEYLQYKHHLHVLEPDLVILNFDMSDVQDHLEYSRSGVWSSDGRPLYVTEPSLGRSGGVWPGLLSFEWVARKVTTARRRFESSREDSPFARDLDRYLWAIDGGRDMEKEARSAMAPIADLRDLLKHHAIPLVLATYPQPWQTSADATPLGPIRAQYGIGAKTVHLNDRSFRLVERFAEEQKIPFVNATASFRQDAQPAGLFLQTDFHFNGRGHQLYSDVLARYILESGVLPALGR